MLWYDNISGSLKLNSFFLMCAVMGTFPIRWHRVQHDVLAAQCSFSLSQCNIGSDDPGIIPSSYAPAMHDLHGIAAPHTVGYWLEPEVTW